MGGDTMIRAEDVNSETIAANDAELARQREAAEAALAARAKLLADLAPQFEHLTLELDETTTRFDVVLNDFVDALTFLTKLRVRRLTMARTISKVGGEAEARMVSRDVYNKLRELDFVLRAFRNDTDIPEMAYRGLR